MKSKMKRASFLALALALCTSVMPSQASAATYGVKVNGGLIADAQPEMVNGQLMIAVRPFAEAFGAQVSWNQSAYMATVTYKGSQIATWIGNNLAFQDGQRLWAPVAPYVKNGQTMVPGHWLATRFGVKVSFDGTNLVVTAPAVAPAPGTQVGSHPLMKTSYVFPYARGTWEPYTDTMGDARYYDGEHFQHEGTDIPAKQGTPIYAVAGGTVVRYGWNTLGGYRITIQPYDNSSYKFYYAHMDRYAPGLYLGAQVKTGQLLGYTGHTGEGPEGTQGNFIPHLHFGIYDANWKAINPYPFLKFWERNPM